ncbi:MAG TPA: ABC transporter permease subunit [Blastocatellia bacterium]|jgi:putative spermidine/putrescine transport system permease protein
MKLRIPMKPAARRWLMLSPALGVIGLLFVGGLALAAAQSFGYFAPTGENAFTLRHYVALSDDREVYASLWLTLKLATLATVISAICALALALGLREFARRSRAVNMLLQIPLSVPHLAMAGALITVIAPSGLLARAVYVIGLIRQPADFPALINDRYGAGILLAYVLKETPFIALMTLALLARLGDEYEQAARVLGASAWQRFRHVTLPLVASAVVSSSLIVFAFIFGAFETPFILGRPYPAMLSVVAQQRYLDVNLTERPGAIALAVISALMTAALAWAYLRLTRALIGLERPFIL